MLSRLFRAYGSFVGTYPLLIVNLSFIALSYFAMGWRYEGTKRGVMSQLSVEQLWNTEGGYEQKDFDTVSKHHNKAPWFTELTGVYLYGKGLWKEKNAVTPDFFTEIEPLYNSFFNLEVTTDKSKSTFTTHDICTRFGGMDFPSTTNASLPWMIFPCQIVSIQDCFSERGAGGLHPTLKFADDLAGLSASNLAFWRNLFGIPTYSPFSSRLSFKNSTQDQMTAAASAWSLGGAKMRGCPSYQYNYVWVMQNLVGSPDLNVDGSLRGTRYIVWWHYFDAPFRIVFRTQAVKPLGLSSEALAHWDYNYYTFDDLKDAKKKMINAWLDKVIDFNKNSKLVETAVSYDQETTIRRLEQSLAKPAWLLLIVGAVLTAVYVCTLSSCTYPMESRFQVGAMGMQMVVLSVAATGGLLLHMQYTFNPTMTQGLPFIMLGLGMDDMFVLCRAFTELGLDFVWSHTHVEVIAEIFASAGAGVTLTSMCNCVAFGLGSLIPVPGLSDFCAGASIGSAVNYFTMVTMFLPFLVSESIRVKRGWPEPLCFYCQTGVCCCCCPTWSNCYHDAVEELDTDYENHSWESKASAWLESHYAKHLMKPLVGGGLTLLMLILLALSLVSISYKTIGYNPVTIAESGSIIQHGFKAFYSDFTAFDTDIFFYDIDVGKMQGDIIQVYADHISLSTGAINGFRVWISEMYGSWNFNGASFNSTQLATAFKPDYYKHPDFAPYGIINPDIFLEALAGYATMPQTFPEYQATLGNWKIAWMWADGSRVREFWWPDGVSAGPKLSFVSFSARVKTKQAFIDAIKQQRQILASSNFQRSQAWNHGIVNTFWSVFMKLESQLMTIFIIDLGSIFVISVAFLQSLQAGIISSCMCLAICLETYGFLCLFLDFNIFMVAILLAVAGIAVEDVAHLAAFFVNAEGTVTDRLGIAMKSTFAAIIQGSISTFLSVVPMGWHKAGFFLEYFCFPFISIVVIGLCNGLFFTPGILAFSSHLVRPCSGTRGAKEVAV